MSVKAMNWVWEHSRSVGTDRLVLLAIADRANDDGMYAWPSVKTLAKKTRLHERTVQRCIQNIRALGELELSDDRGPSGTNVYLLRMDALVLADSSRSKKKVGPRQLAGGGNLPPGGAGAGGGVAPPPPGGGAAATGGVAPPPPDPSGTSCTSSTPSVSPDGDDERDGLPVRPFVSWFCDEFQRQRNGAKYLVQAKKDIPVVRTLLKTYGLERLKAMAALLLTEPRDKFIVESDRGIGVLSVKATWLAIRTGRHALPAEPWVCPHVDPCTNRGMCDSKWLLGPAKYPVKREAAV